MLYHIGVKTKEKLVWKKKIYNDKILANKILVRRDILKTPQTIKKSSVFLKGNIFFKKISKRSKLQQFLIALEIRNV